MDFKANVGKCLSEENDLEPMRRKTIGILIIGLLGLAIIVFVTTRLFYEGIVRFNYPSSTTYPVKGIDVSHHQNEIDWMQVKQQHIQFAFIKATEGGDFKDEKFMTNWNEAILVGVDVGAYHFFTFCRSGREQAQNFIETVPAYDSALPPVVDLEFGGNCRLKIDDKTLLAEVDTLLQLLAEKYQKTPILYATHEFYDRFLIDRFHNNPLWIRDIYREPTLIDGREWLFWQYANRGHLDGIDAFVDFNVYNGTRAAYDELKK